MNDLDESASGTDHNAFLEALNELRSVLTELETTCEQDSLGRALMARDFRYQVRCLKQITSLLRLPYDNEWQFRDEQQPVYSTSKTALIEE